MNNLVLILSQNPKVLKNACIGLSRSFTKQINFCVITHWLTENPSVIIFFHEHREPSPGVKQRLKCRGPD